MARGFESKSVADQQEHAQNRANPRAHRESGDTDVVLRKRKLELARADLLHQMKMARAEAHREMLRRALQALDKDLAELG